MADAGSSGRGKHRTDIYSATVATIGANARLAPLPNFTVSVGGCFNAGFRLYTVVCGTAINVDSSGNAAVGGITGGLGLTTGVTLSGVGMVQVTNAANVNELKGPFVNVGYSGGEGPVAGADVNLGRGSHGIITGVTVSGGYGYKFTYPYLPVEAHGYLSGTWFPFGTFKLW